MELEARGFIRAVAAAEDLHHARAKFRPIKLPSYPLVALQAVRGQRIVVTQHFCGHFAPFSIGFLQHRDIATNHAEGRHVETSIRILVVEPGRQSVVRQPGRKPVGVALRRFRHPSLVHLIEVGAAKRHGAAHAFQIVAASAGGTGIDSEPWVPAKQLIPKRQVPLDVVVFRHPLTIRWIVFPPGWTGTPAVHVLAIPVDALGFDHAIHVIDQPIQRRRISLVQNGVVAGVVAKSQSVGRQKPFRMVLGQP